ncbi:MAG: YceI family protein, partial [Bacteroidales bacterium]
MKNYLRIWFLLAGLPALTHTLTHAQQYVLDQDVSSVTIEGTSNLHDWTMDVTEISGTLTASCTANALSFSETYVTVQSGSVTAENNIMNSKTQEALKTKQHPLITYKSKSITLNNTGKRETTGKTYGILTISGVAKKLGISFKGSFTDNRSFRVHGKFEVYMTHFDVKPPTALLGSLKTG